VVVLYSFLLSLYYFRTRTVHLYIVVITNKQIHKYIIVHYFVVINTIQAHVYETA